MTMSKPADKPHSIHIEPKQPLPKQPFIIALANVLEWLDIRAAQQQMIKASKASFMPEEKEHE